MVLVAYDKSPEVEEPRDGSLNDPAMTIASKLASILSCQLLSTSSMRTDELNVTINKAVAKPVGVSRPVVDQPWRHAFADTRIDKSFERVNFRLLAASVNIDNRIPLPSTIHRILLPLPFLVRPTSRPLFLRARTCRYPLLLISAAAFADPFGSVFARLLPDSAHSRCRRWQIEGEGYRLVVNLAIEHRS